MAIGWAEVLFGAGALLLIPLTIYLNTRVRWAGWALLFLIALIFVSINVFNI